MEKIKVKVKDVAYINQSNFIFKDKTFINYLDTSSITDNCINDYQLLSLSEKIPSRAKRAVKNGTIVYSTVRPNQHHFGFLENIPENTVVSTGFVTIDAKDCINPYYLYCSITNPFKINHIARIAESSTSSYPSFRPEDLGNMEIEIYKDKDVQNAVAVLLKDLENKILNNNNITNNLISLAKTIYDYWFLQFEFPNIEGKPYKSSGGKMIWNEELKRKIPEGWEVVTLKDKVNKNTEKYVSDSIVPTIDLSVMPSNSISLNSLNSSDQFTTNLYKMKEGQLLFGSIRPYLLKAGIAPCDGAVAGTVHSYTVRKIFDYNFIAMTMFSPNMFDFAIQKSKGTKMPVISSDDLCSFKFAYSEQISKLFNNINFVDLINHNVKENQQLSQLRDYLLPLLMNGQVTFK